MTPDELMMRITPAMLEAAAEVLYGHPRAKAIEWAKEDKFDSCVDQAAAMLCAAINAAEHELAPPAATLHDLYVITVDGEAVFVKPDPNAEG